VSTSQPIRRTRRRAALAIAIGVLAGVGVVVAQPTAALAAAFSSTLTRAPYLTDLTATSVRVNWATTTQTKAVVKYGPLGACTSKSVTSLASGSPITIGSAKEYQNSVAITGLSAGSTYCYRVFTTATGTDLLATNLSPSFKTLAPSGPTTFAVLGDWGDTTNNGVNDGTTNANQAALLAQVGASGSQFALSTGDIGYPGGSQTNYGDLQQKGADVSAVFGPSYWATPGQSLPQYTITANHGRNSNFMPIWPQDATAAASGGVYGMVSYPKIDGATATSYPTSYYAFTAGGVRFYMLDVSWSNGNVGTATGGACGSHCAMYQVDHDAHWTLNSAEYVWLKKDLAANPGTIKMAAFHFPLRSDDPNQPSDVYLQNTPGSTGSLEQLLSDNGVKLVFNGHAHIYQRNVAPPNGVISYVTGGGGASLTNVSTCASTDAYAMGWSYSSKAGKTCGAAPAPTSNAQVHHFLKVTVNGSTVTVTPTDSQGRTFDVQTYNFGADASPPSAPGNLVASKPSSTKAQLTWAKATDNVGVSAYDIYRNGAYVATTTPAVTTYTDAIVSGVGYTYQVAARDLARNSTRSAVAVNGGGSTDGVAPTAPTNLTATSTSPTTVALSWQAATDNVGIASYTIMRGGVAIASVAGSSTTYSDTGLTPGSPYSYQVVAKDVAGNSSVPSNSAAVTTTNDTTGPTTPGTPTVTSVSSSQVSLAWTASTDSTGVVQYDILRGGAIVGTASGTSFTDTTVTAGSTYTYAIKAFDAAGNSATSGSTAVTTPTSGSAFSDGFESGNLAQWSTVSGMTVQNSIVHTGANAARMTSAGTATYAYETLPNSYSEAWAQAWVYEASRSSSVNLFGFRLASGGSIVNVYTDSSGRLSLRNNVGVVTTYSSTVLPLGSWHRIVLHVVINGTASKIDVSLDCVPVPGLVLTGQSLGTGLAARLQLGETSTGRTYDVIMDDVTVSPTAL
jgi:fibronectin type 3 domain-containing protein